MRRVSAGRRPVVEAAIEAIDGASPRSSKNASNRRTRSTMAPSRLALVGVDLPECPLDVDAGGEDAIDHVEWVQGLSTEQVDAGVAWLRSIADAATRTVS